MRYRTIIALAIWCPVLWTQTFQERLPAGGRFVRSVGLEADQSVAVEVTREGSGDLQIAIRVEGKPVRELTSFSYSKAPVRLVLWTERRCTFEVMAANGSRAELGIRAEIGEPHAATEQDRQRWEAEALLYAPPASAPKMAPEDTEARLRRTAEFFHQAGDSYKWASTLRLLGNWYTRRQDFTAAREAYAQSAALLRELSFRFEEAVVRQNLANAISETGDDRGAIAELDGVLALRSELRDELGRGITLYGRARSRWHMGELQAALDDYRLALTVFRKLSEERWEATVRSALGLLQAELGQTDAARASYAESAAIWRRLNDQNGLMMNANNLGMLKESLGQHEAARADFREASRLSQTLGNRQAQAYILQNIGDVAANEGDHARALRDYQESLDIKQQLKDVRAAAETRRKMGLSYLAMGDKQAARSALDEALTESRAASDRTGEAQSLAALARLESSGATRVAEQRIEAAVRLIETTRVELRTRDLRTSYFSTQRDFYDFAIDLAMSADGSGAAAALEWSERQRARMLLDAVQRAGANAADPLARIASAEEIRRDLRAGEEALVEYSTGPLRTWAWVVTSTQVRAVRLPGWNEIGPKLEKLRRAVDALEGGAGKAEARRNIEASLKEVAAQVWWPLRVAAGTRRVVIAADAGMERIPFAALPMQGSGGRLIEHAEVDTVPSASLAGAIRKSRATYPKRIAIFADPVFSDADLRVDAAHRGEAGAEELARLRFSREEAQEIVRRASGGVAVEWLDFRASAENLRRAAAEAGSILHLATHALVDGRDPAASRLVVSRVDSEGRPAGGEVRLNDVYNLRIRRELVVLSACHAAEGAEIRGEGMLSLTRAFLYAGARGVVASLWRVGDRASAELMRRFYEGLLTRQETPGQALRSAQMGMMKDPRWSGVENWAPFLFSGDWRITPWERGRE